MKIKQTYKVNRLVVNSFCNLWVRVSKSVPHCTSSSVDDTHRFLVCLCDWHDHRRGRRFLGGIARRGEDRIREESLRFGDVIIIRALRYQCLNAHSIIGEWVQF